MILHLADAARAWILIAAGLLGIVAAFAAYLGQQSLRQGLLLLRTVPGRLLAARIGQPVAVCGKAERLDVERGLRSQLLYRRVIQQERTGGGRNSSWRTVSDVVEHFHFQLDVDGVEVDVDNRATEVHGTRDDTDYGGGSWFLGVLFGDRPRRTTTRELYGLRRITAVGTLRPGTEGRLRLVRDPGLGMLLSSRAGRKQGWIELAKGALGLLCPVAWGAGCAYVYTHGL